MQELTCEFGASRLTLLAYTKTIYWFSISNRFLQILNHTFPLQVQTIFRAKPLAQRVSRLETRSWSSIHLSCIKSRNKNETGKKSSMFDLDKKIDQDCLPWHVLMQVIFKIISATYSVMTRSSCSRSIWAAPRCLSGVIL